MSYIKDTFTRFKDFVIYSSTTIKRISNQLSISNLKSLLQVEYIDLKAKLKDIKGTNWDLAQYHFTAGNHNDAIMRFKILQKNNYRLIESNYFLGRIYLEKKDYTKAKTYLNAYLSTQDSNYKSEAQYCMSIINNLEISSIPNSVIINKRDRITLNLEKSSLDITLLNRYSAIIHILKSEINSGAKILEIGCYIGVLGRIIKESFGNNIQYFVGSEIGPEAGQVAEAMHLGETPVYDRVKVCKNISEIAADDAIYSIVLVPDILSYYSDLLHFFVQIFTSLGDGGSAIVVARVIKENNTTESCRDMEFIHPIEEFRYGYEYLVKSAESCQLQLKNSNDIGDGFELFVFKKV